MKKIRFGSFPLVEVNKGDRRCLDKYLIKNFSDNISISDAMRNLNLTKNLMYITPDSLMREWYSNGKSKNDGTGRHVSYDSRSNGGEYEKILTRAFYILKDFYKNVSHKPFYREYVYYPIYIEKVESVSVSNVSHSKMNYSFIVLSNDLDVDLKIDEIRYDENTSLNLLYLFIEFFVDPEKPVSAGPSTSTSSINNINEEDLGFLVKLYQYIEKLGKEPIVFMTELYKFFGVLQSATTNAITSGGINKGIQDISKLFATSKIDDFRKYNGVLRTQFITSMKAHSIGTDAYRKSFIQMMNTLFSEKGFVDIIGDSKPDSELMDRSRIIYNTSKYQELISLAKELVKYNKLGKDKIVINDQIDFDFHVESGGTTFDVQGQMVVQKYTEYFNNFLKKLKIKLNEGIDEFSETQSRNNIDTSDLVKLREAKTDKERQIKLLSAYIVKLEAEVNNLYYVISMNGYDTTTAIGTSTINKYNTLSAELRTRHNDLVILETENTHQATAIATVENLHKRAIVNNATAVSKDGKPNVIEYIANDLTYLYDDLQDLFKNETLVTQFLNDPILDTHRFESITRGGSSGADSQFLLDFVKTIDEDITIMAGSIYENITAINRDIRRRMGVLNTPAQDIGKDGQIQMYKLMLRELVVNEFFKNINRIFSRREYKQSIARDDKLSELHPIIIKMLRDPNTFKSFILNFNTIENLYNLWFMTQTKKYMAGLLRRVPQKLNNPRNKVEYVIENLLGLHKNPVWIIGDTKLYLSMPDYLSLTNTKILSSIDKSELKNICRIDAKDYWDENRMGKMVKTKDASKDVQTETKNVDDVEKKLIDAKAEQTPIDPKKKIAYEQRIRNLEAAVTTAKKRLTQAENKSKSNKDQMKLNLFDREPIGYGDGELLNRKETDDLSKNKRDILPFGSQLPNAKSYQSQVPERENLEYNMPSLDLNKPYPYPQPQRDQGQYPQQHYQPPQPFDPYTQRDHDTNNRRY